MGDNILHAQLTACKDVIEIGVEQDNVVSIVGFVDTLLGGAQGTLPVVVAVAVVRAVVVSVHRVDVNLRATAAAHEEEGDETKEEAAARE